MSNWNESYTRKKQKEMAEKVASESQSKPAWVEPRPLVSPSTIQRRMVQERHDKFCWRVGYCIIGIITGLFIWLLIEIL